MKTILTSLMLVSLAAAGARAQVAPAANGGAGPSGLPSAGNMQYAIRYAQSAQFSNILPNLQTSTMSGSFSYVNRNLHLPFAIDYGGGYTWTLTGPSYETGLFQRMLISQGIDWRKWKMSFYDNVSYLPQSPTVGFSGVPGTGEPIGTPNPTPSTSQSILTINTHVVDNVASGHVEHVVSYATSFLAGGSSEILRFPDNNGLDVNTMIADGIIAQRLSARNTLYGRYLFSQYSFPGSTVSIDTNTGLVGFKRKWTRNFMTDFGAGPEWIASSDNTVVPTATNFAANASADYMLRFTTINVNYTHGTNGGSGYVIGGEVDSVQGTFSRQIGLNLGVGLMGGFERTSGLNNGSANVTAYSGTTHASFGGVESTWRLGRNLIMFANYTAMNQNSTAGLPSNVANELLQVIGFGFGFSPREIHTRQ